MPSEGRRLHGFTVISRGLRLARQLLLPAIVGGVSVGGDFADTAQWVLLILTVPSLGIAVAQWLVFRYRLEADELIIDSGVLARRRRVIPLARVQNIDLEQSLIDRLAGVAELRLETASGGSQTEAGLAVLGLAEAQELQSELMRRRARAQGGAAAAGSTSMEAAGPRPAPDGGVAAPVPPADAAAPAAEQARPRVLLRLGLADLVIAGATSNDAGLIAAGLATLLEVVDDFGRWDWLRRAAEGVLGERAALGVAGAVVAVLVIAVSLFVLGWLVSIVATVVRFYGFTLTRAGDDLRREYGLLSRHRSTVPLERVQAVRIEETLIRQPLKLAALKIETAGAAPGRGSQPGGRAEAFVPLARRRQVGALLAEVFEDARFDGVTLNPVAAVSRRRSFIRLAVPIIVAAAGVALWVDREGIALLLLLAPAWLFARAQYRARAWGRASRYTLARGGVFNRRTWVVPERKIQTLHLRETPFQRRWHIATVMIDTAAGGRIASIVDVHRDTGIDLLVRLAADGEAARREALSNSRGARGA